MGYCCPIHFAKKMVNKLAVKSLVQFQVLLSILNRTTVLHVIQITPKTMEIAQYCLLRMSYFQSSVHEVRDHITRNENGCLMRYPSF